MAEAIVAVIPSAMTTIWIASVTMTPRMPETTV
jgi:hypothetical protein